MAGESGPGFELDVTDLRGTLAAVKEFNPALARSLRRRLRASGEQIIGEQRRILDGPLPGLAKKSGSTVRWVKAKDGRRGYLRKVNTYESVAAKGNRSTGMRSRIKSSLATRVMTSKSRQGVAVRAQTRIGGVMAVQWQAKRFRHPAFGTGTFVEQHGQPYFWGPAIAGRDAARLEIERAIADAVAEISN